MIFPLRNISVLAVLALMGCKGASPNGAGSPQVDPAGQKFDAWLAAFNSGDHSRIERAYVDSPLAKLLTASSIKIAEETGGYELHHVEAAGPTERIALAKEKKSGTWRCLKFHVQSDPPHGIDGFMYGNADPPEREAVSAPLPALDQQARREVIDALAREIERAYVFPDKAAAMARELRSKQNQHAYDMPARLDLLRAVNPDLRRISGDGHLRLDVSCSSSQARPASEAVKTSQHAVARRMLGEPRRLDGDVAYIEVTTFEPVVAEVRDEVREKMSAVADARALIFDLRKNGGGLAETVAFLTSYVSGKEPVQLGSAYKRGTNKTEELFTDPNVPGPKFGADKPVYVLTSRYTFSASESFAYDLQVRKRAVIVGEKTGGGAHPGDVVHLGHGFAAFIPDTRVIHPVTKTDWEGVGVKPDVEVPADKAFDTAQKLAVERIRGRP